VELKVNNRIARGFRIGMKDRDVYYDLTDESIVEQMKEFLNPALGKLLEESQGKGKAKSDG
jgi:vacuolar-type H+-ATPase subunit E/Vma4